MKNKLKSDNIIQSEYESACEFLYGFVNYERGSDWKYNDSDFNLTRLNKLLGILGNPHKKGRFVHIAGTNGKGSVGALIASVLAESGYKAGLYTSPHLITFRERIRINGELISKEDIAEEAAIIRDIFKNSEKIGSSEKIESSKKIENLTFFDIWTSIAFNYFARQSVDISVIETGLGGRLDSTNVIEPDVSVITSISMDHGDKLGDTLEKIAFEKAGIIKPGIPVVCAPQTGTVKSVIEKQAQKTGADFIYSGNDNSITLGQNGLKYSGLSWEIDNLKIPLSGDFQRENSALALTTLELLSAKLPHITKESARTGIKNVSWPGRLQTIALKPEIILDGASNIGAITAVKDFLLGKKPEGKIIALFGVCGDKKVKQLIGILQTAVSQFVFTRANNPRALNADEILHKFGSISRDICETAPDTALKKACSLAGPNGLVIVTGSLYLVGDIMKYYNLKA